MVQPFTIMAISFAKTNHSLVQLVEYYTFKLGFVNLLNFHCLKAAIKAGYFVTVNLFWYSFSPAKIDAFFLYFIKFEAMIIKYLCSTVNANSFKRKV